jgi:hypothetical protein
MRRVRVAVAAAALAVAVGAGAWLRLGARPGYRTEHVRWESGAIEIAGTLYLPAGAGPHPAAVFAPGYGDWTRHERLFRVHAERLAARGLALLIYDKRGCGESGGDWRRASLAELAADALGGHALLRTHPSVDPDAVGLFGTSQGGLIAVLAATREPAVAFVATLSLSTRSPEEHGGYLARERVLRAGFSAADAAAAEALHLRIADAVRASPAGAAPPLVDAPADAPWLAAADLERLVRDPEARRALRDLPLDLDPVELLAALEVPLFAAQGADDWEVPAERAARVLAELRDRRGLDVTLAWVEGAGHVLRTRTGWGPFERWSWPDAYWDALDAWLARVLH